jgi:hypothetical protein
MARRPKARNADAAEPAATRDIAAFLRERVVPAGGSRHGLVIGIEQYRDSRLNLRCAAADARAICDLMTDPDCGMFPKGNVRLLLNAEATKQNIWRALSALRRSAGENDTVWVYYAGHAATEESNLYWVTHDADVDDLYGTGLSNGQISKVLEDIRASRLLVLLDCCHAAATAMQKNPTRAVLTAEEVFRCYKGRGRITLSSSDGKEKSVELGDVGHGAFTYFLEKGLRGEADKDNDGVVTADELWQYLRGQVTSASQRVGKPQTPVLLGEMTHELALTLNPIAASHKKHIADEIVRLIGLGDGKLNTTEAEFCLEILRRGPMSKAERDLADEFSALAEGKIRIVTFRRLVQAASGTRPDAAIPVPTSKTPAVAPPPPPSPPQGPLPHNDVRRIVMALIQKLASDDWEVRLEAVTSLAKKGPEATAALPKLSALLADEDTDVRQACRKAIVAIGFANSCQAGVEEALSADDWQVLVEVARFLGEIGRPAQIAVPFLTKLLADEDKDVRKAAEEALERIYLDRKRVETLPPPGARRGNQVFRSHGLMIMCLTVTLICAAVIVLHERRLTQRLGSLDEAAKVVTSIAADHVVAANDNSIVCVTGRAEPTAPLMDAEFGVQAKAIELKRQVEIFLSVHYDADPRWRGEWRDKLVADYGQENPDVIPYHEATYTTPELSLGSFTLSETFCREWREDYERFSLDALTLNAVSVKSGQQGRVFDGALYFANDPARPNVGDVRVSYTAILPQVVSLIARQKGRLVEPIAPTAWHATALVTKGPRSSDALLAQAHDSAVSSAWMSRVFSSLCCIVTWCIMLNPNFLRRLFGLRQQ